MKEWHLSFYKNAQKHSLGYWLGTNTWRANPDWEEKLGANLDESWKLAAKSSLGFRREFETPKSPIVICGVVGPRRDGYQVSLKEEVEDYRKYHSRQIQALRDAGVDLISAYTMNHFEEAAGIVLAAQDADIPVTISFTVETDGLLPNGESLASTVAKLEQHTNKYALFYMVNCAHPTHLRGALKECHGMRFNGFMPNSSHKSHAELDESTELDEGEFPETLGDALFDTLQEFNFPVPSVVAGCCGTGMVHLESLANAFVKL